MSGKKRNVMLFVLLFTLLLGVIVPVQAQSYGGTKTIRVAYREDADFINKSSSGVYKGYGVKYLSIPVGDMNISMNHGKISWQI